jgi:hypothetical protein
MRIVALAAAMTLAITASASAAESPFAAAPPVRLDKPEASNLSSLGDIMGQTQLRHIKLWYAGRSEAWDLVDYELDRISESLVRAAVSYTNIPVEFIQRAEQPLAGMRTAIATKDELKFTQSYADLTAACNACHQAGRVGFIRIQTPTSSPFSDEVLGR